MLERMQVAKKLRLEKCHFAQRKVKYLGHLVTADGIKPDPEKIAAVKRYRVPVNTKEVKGFLGLAGYYRRFIAGFSDLAKPLTSLLRKGVTFTWGKY